MNSIKSYLEKHNVSISLFLSFFAFIISVFSLQQGCENIKYVKKQFEISQLPNWFLEKTYAENNVDLLSVTMKSNLQGITVKKMSVFPPSDFISNDTIEVIGDIWRTYGFINDLNKTVASYFQTPEPNSVSNTSWITRYPVAIKVEYFQNNQTKYSTCLFLLHIRIFNQEKIKVYNIEPIEFIDNVDPNEILKRINVLNNTAGLRADIIYSGRYPSIYNEAFHIFDLSKQVNREIIKVLDENLMFKKYDTSYFPLFTYKKEQKDSINQILTLLIDNSKILPENITLSIKKASDFIDSHPLKGDSEDLNNFILNSSWRSKKTFSKWLEIVKDLNCELCMEFSTKYKLLECDTAVINKNFEKYLEAIN